MSDNTRSEQEGHTDVDRRALLRTGGAAVVASVAGLAVVETVTASSAQAAIDGPVLMSHDNDAENTSTTVTSSSLFATFTCSNIGGAAPFNLTTVPTPATGDAFHNGDLANFDGNLYYTNGDFGVGFVYTEYTANQVVPIGPQRVLDTRTVAGRAHILNPSGNLDAGGRLLANHIIEVTLGTLEVAATAAFCNLTAVSPAAAGYLTLWPGGALPTTSTVNYAKGSFATANFAVTGTSATDTVFIYSYATTHVLLDITAFAVGTAGQINVPLAGVAANGSGQRLAARARAGTLPSWFKRL
jgi:hypothetical protein